MFLKILLVILMLLSMALTGFLGWTLMTTNLLPRQMLLLAVGLLIILPMLLYLVQKEKKGGSKKTGTRIAVSVMLLFLCIVQAAVLYFLNPYNKAMDQMTAGETQVTVIRVYVKAEDPAQTIEYAVESQYRFGTIANVDEGAVEKVRTEIEQKCGRKMIIEPYENLLELVQALEKGDADALIISTAYVELMDSLEGYEDLAESLRVLHTSSVESKLQPNKDPVEREIDPELEEILNAPDLWEDSFCAYISGIDTFGQVSTRSRSDVNILAIVNKSTKTVLLINTPRDYYLPFNVYPAGGALDKLTHAGVYGIDSSIQVLSDYYAIPISYYLRLNFTGFIKIIDTLGGVDVDNDIAFGSGGYHFDKGQIHLDGYSALAYARCRSFEAGDRVRGRHQMYVIRGVINGLMSSNALANYSDLMAKLSNSFQTDMPKEMIGELVQLTLDRSNGDWKVLTYSVDGAGRTDMCFSLGCKAYVMVPYPDTLEYARQLVISVISGESMTQDELNAGAPKH